MTKDTPATQEILRASAGLSLARGETLSPSCETAEGKHHDAAGAPCGAPAANTSGVAGRRPRARLATSGQRHAGTSKSQSDQARERKKRDPGWKGREKLSLFTGDTEKSNRSTEKVARTNKSGQQNSRIRSQHAQEAVFLSTTQKGNKQNSSIYNGIEGNKMLKEKANAEDYEIPTRERKA